jgi:phosphoribosylglycinamide formyltransferase 2|tara:strand:+ start:345 stop:1469 length:1125 start_codon:yes stop_codon:yes gene_type:complete
MKKILLLGSGELGKEFAISAKRLGCFVVACDNYENAPAMQIADEFKVFDMLDADTLRKIIEEVHPDLIVPEVEAIRTEILIEQEQKGYVVVPSAKAANLTMNRDKIRDRAVELGLRTAKFAYAETKDSLIEEAKKINYPVVIKPVMSSSGKGQSIAKNESEIVTSWNYAIKGMRGDRQRVIVEEFIDFSYEITLLTIKQHAGPTLFCKSIGHVQERGDYQWSWQPGPSDTEVDAQKMAKVITDDLGGAGIFGVEFFITKKGEVIFSELSPRPHDTGMVTMYTQDLSEFDLHARAILGLPIPEIKLLRPGASHVVLASKESDQFTIEGVEDAMLIPGVEVRIFGKPTTRVNRRMAVVLAPDIETAKKAAGKISIN